MFPACPEGTTHERASACVAPDGRIASVVFIEPGEAEVIGYPIALTIEDHMAGVAQALETPGGFDPAWLSTTFLANSGQLDGINVHLRGTRRSVAILFHDNGILSLYKEEEHGKGNGLIRSWHRNGVLRWTGQMRDDHPDGVHLHWDESGQFVKQIVWEMGVLQFESGDPPK
jgi:hypothetical protein